MGSSKAKEALVSENKSLVLENKSLTSDIALLKARTSTSDAVVASLTAEKDKLTGKLKDLKSQNEGIAERARKNNARHKEEIVKLKLSCETKDKRIKELENDNRRLAEKFEDKK